MIDQFTSQGPELRQYVQNAMQKTPSGGLCLVHGLGVNNFRRALYDALKLHHDSSCYPYDTSWLRRPYPRKRLMRHPLLISQQTDLVDLERDKLLVKQLQGEDAKRQDWEGRLTGVILCLQDKQKPKFRSRKLNQAALRVEVDCRGAVPDPQAFLDYLRTRDA